MIKFSIFISSLQWDSELESFKSSL